MNWLNKLERKFGRYAVHNLTTYLIGTYIIGYAIRLFIPDMMIWLYLQPGAILHGQIWRIVSWILVPPQGSLLEIVIMLMLYYSLGTTLERTWGAFRYNVYIFSGILFTVLGAFVLYILYGSGADFLGGYFSTYYINLSIFLAFAASYPDMELLLYFILPIKIKWMGQTRPHMTYANGAKHRCAVCGRTELDDSSLEFRFCSKCNGNYEYCQDHLFTHQHVK